MSSAALSTSILLLLICFVGHGSCGSPTENDGTITWNDDFQEKNEGSGLNTEYDAKGLQPWYNFANSFISTVLNKDPYGEFSVLFCSSELIHAFKGFKEWFYRREETNVGYSFG